MTCAECHDYVDAYFDNELDVSATILVKQHLAGCTGCRQLLESRKYVRTLLHDPALRTEAPESLRERIRASLPSAPVSVARATPPPRKWNLPWLVAPLGLAAAVAITVTLFNWGQNGGLDRDRRAGLVNEVIANHVRSLLATHLLDVVSTDQHTVKPWFNGKLKFAPPVHDFQDFRLIGGRLDYLSGQEVAALVYQRNKHVINLFVRPVAASHPSEPEDFTANGYNILHWEKDGFEFWAVSDLNATELKQFRDLEQQPT